MKFRKIASLLGIVATLAAGPRGTAGADLLYGVNSSDDSLSIIDAETGLVNLVGPLGEDFRAAVAMAIRPSDGAIFIWTNDSAVPENQGLATVNPATGAATFVGVRGDVPLVL
jgi:hypothetical protein